METNHYATLHRKKRLLEGLIRANMAEAMALSDREHCPTPVLSGGSFRSIKAMLMEYAEVLTRMDPQ
ncbi:hypothetical protein [Spirosoma agri]|uniref:Uncharacterized protein n=1 Tax=Spirosoma agri TaxID=1987381 RepID=A0A6M0IGI7_9BACT|nr:hypothetical protein [Spirosoma agri]NEU67396.1 hypothetical protein [Spirosoma agri]